MIEQIDRIVDALSHRFFGKYRGEVVGTDDETERGRLLVRCPAVMGTKELWAMPCVPYAGAQLGLFALPPKGTSVWIEFEGGELDHPIWSGCFWKRGEIDAADAKEGVAFLRTPGATLRIDNDAGMLEIETAGGAKITLSSEGVKIEGAEIAFEANGGAAKVSPSGFDAMNGAFTVT